MPLDDPGATSGTADPDELVRRAQAVADDLLAPAAQVVDRSTSVPASHLDALSDAGLFGVAGPRSAGGSALDGDRLRRTFAALAGGCGATFFVWAQHHGVVGLLAAGERDDLRERWLAPMCAGEVRAGTAFAHLRRPGPPMITAHREPRGWRIEGRAPWTTSWGIADVFTVAAETDDGRVVWALVEGPTSTSTTVPSIHAEPLALPVLAATRTAALRFDRLHVGDADVVSIGVADRWRAADRVRSARGSPAALGVAHRAIAGIDGSDAGARAAVSGLRRDLAAAWETDEALARALEPAASDTDDVRRADVVDRASEHRASNLDLARRATTAALAAAGGRAMELSHPAQRLAREAAFYVVQAQTADGRAATLAAQSSSAGGTGLPARVGAVDGTGRAAAQS
ncbi:acyl-CoA dehydrogenase family protein [Ilumatobacter sp.]|uniref:acyl-CoA dehydrogenase family protein n=1 Tax=Ilumatobacter sp. TaxID=1967498 RepID=UPI003B52F8F4